MGHVERVSKFKVGTKVKLTDEYLRDSGMMLGDYGFARGIITEILSPDKPYARAQIEWDTPDMPDRVILSKLAVVPERSRG